MNLDENFYQMAEVRDVAEVGQLIVVEGEGGEAGRKKLLATS